MPAKHCGMPLGPVPRPASLSLVVGVAEGRLTYPEVAAQLAGWTAPLH